MRKTIPLFNPVALLIIFLLFNPVDKANARPNTDQCPAGQTIAHSFYSSARWDMCWEIREKEGLVLSNIHYKPTDRDRRRILGEASLSQIQTEYDDGSESEFLVTDIGLGGNHTQTLTKAMCEGGRLHGAGIIGRNVVCELHQRSGYLYRYEGNTQRQGNKLIVFSISTVNSREFIIQWVFLENGTIQVDLGIAGQFSQTTKSESTGWKVSADDTIVASFVDHFFWRLDFDLDTDSTNDIVEQIKSISSPSRLKKNKETLTISNELAASFVPAEKKFWRILDGSIKNKAGAPISYEMVMLSYAHQNKGNSDSPWLKNDIYITKYNECERFAVHNTFNNKLTEDCANNVSEFINAENTNEKDIVVWYRLAHHTLPSDEDFYPATVQWSSFILLPRDWTSSNRL